MNRPSLRTNTPLLRRAQADPNAFGEFYDAYSRRVLRFFARRVFDPEVAFDLTSETFAKALAGQHQFRGGTTEEEQGWLFAIARSELSHFWRRGEVERAALAKLGIERPALTSDDTDRIEELAALAEWGPRLQTALDELPIEQRQAVYLRVVEEMDYSKLAMEIGESEQVARARVSRGLRALGSALAEHDEAVLEESR